MIDELNTKRKGEKRGFRLVSLKTLVMIRQKISYLDMIQCLVSQLSQLHRMPTIFSILNKYGIFSIDEIVIIRICERTQYKIINNEYMRIAVKWFVCFMDFVIALTKQKTKKKKKRQPNVVKGKTTYINPFPYN